MGCITYRTGDGKVIRGYRRECCEELYGELAAWGSDYAYIAEDGFVTDAVDWRGFADDEEREAYAEDGLVESFGIRWEQVCNREAEHEYDVEGWYNFECEWRATNSTFPFVLMEDGTVWERLDSGDGYRFAFDALDPEVFVSVNEVTPEQAAMLPEAGAFVTAIPWWPTGWAGDGAPVIRRAWFYDAEGEAHETRAFFEG